MLHSYGFFVKSVEKQGPGRQGPTFFFFFFDYAEGFVGSQFTDQGSTEPRPSAVKAQSPNCWTTGEFPGATF